MTPCTQALRDLLCRFPRQAIRAVLANERQPEELLLKRGADLEQLLEPRPRPWAAFGRPTTQRVTGFYDDDFPDLLRQIPDPPLVLFYEGDLRGLAASTIAVVGARRCTRMGAESAKSMARALAEQQTTVVSGLATGIDGAAHRGALMERGLTVAVLGGSLDRLYPRAHASLAKEILRNGGAVVSEYPPGTSPRPHQFPERNRLISGAALATVLIEASDRSGSLITARLALEQGRDVYAMPGPVNSLVSRGCHIMIQQGAGLVTGADDLLAELAWCRPRPPAHETRSALTPAQAPVLAALHGYPQTLDELMLELASSDAADLDVARLSELLSELELAGFVAQSPLGYIRTS